MKTFRHWLHVSRRAAFVFVANTLLFVATARGQLAITEMMSSASTHLGTNLIVQGSDFWELTNFGTNTLDLAGYQIADATATLRPLLQPGDPPLLIHSNESIVFVRNNVYSNEMQFRAWWGSCIGSNVQIRFYVRPGFSGAGDGFRLYDPAGNLLESVDFGLARQGVSFTYDTNSGEFAAYSVLGQGGACKAATADDIASPGVTTGPIPLSISQQPTNLTVCAGLNATLGVNAIGMPRPKYQWFFDNNPIPGATAANYTVTNAAPANTGSYRVNITNGLGAVQSSNALLTVSTNPSAPSIVMPPVSSSVYTGQTARFSVSACAFPPATNQWFSNGIPLTGATNRTLTIPNSTFAMSGTEYCVRVQNSLGTNTVCARLTVTTKPDVRITEIQAFPFAACSGHHDWFELTNFGTNAVDLLGWRFADAFTFAGAVVVTQSIVIQPAESAVFIKSQTPESFLNWWGAEQLPPDLKLIPYAGFSLSQAGDALYLWNAGADAPLEYINSKSLAQSIQGTSFIFDETNCYFGCDTVAAEFGAVRSLECDDIGSPGYTTNPPPRLVKIARDASGAHLKWRAVEGKTYELQYNMTPQSNGWAAVGSVTATNSLPTMTDTSATNQSNRFYRVRQLAP